jgi:Fe-S cluster biogenesis protein NfuA
MTAPQSELAARVEDALKRFVAPAMELDGSGIEVVAVEDGIASVRLAGVCASCPSSLMTVVTGMEAELKKHVPEIDIIEAVP